jgi:hypothetical protein
MEDGAKLNIFDAIDENGGLPGAEQDAAPDVFHVKAQAEQAPAKPNPFDAIDDAGNLPGAPEASSATGAFVHHAGREVLPGAGGFAAFGAGAELGALAAPMFGPAAPIAPLVGGLAASVLGAGAVEKVQDWALSKLPDTWQDALGQSEAQRKAEETEHKYASFLGGLLPFAMTMRPGKIPPGLLPENATALQRIVANPTTARLFGGGVMGGMELGQELAAGESPDWVKISVSTGAGLVFNKPTKFGERLTEIGARPVRAAFGVPHPGPTVAEANAGGVVGEGVTESTFRGGTERDPEAKKVAEEQRMDEMRALGEDRQAPDVNAVARQMHPELFSEYDALQEQARHYREWLEEHRRPDSAALAEVERRRNEAQAALDAHVEARNGYTGGPEARKLRADLRIAQKDYDDTVSRRWQSGMGEPVAESPEAAQVRKHLIAVDEQLRDKGREIAAARLRAAEAKTPDAIIEPEPGTAGDLPPVKEGFTRFFHGAKNNEAPAEARWVSPSFEYARDWGRGEGPPNKVWYIDVPDTAPEMAKYLEDMQLYGDLPRSSLPAPPSFEAPFEYMREARLANATPSQPPAVEPIEAQKAQIAAEAERRALDAGRPPEEAKAYGALTAERYATRAGVFEGKRGTALEMFRQEGAEIRGERPPETPTAPEAAGDIQADPIKEYASDDQGEFLQDARGKIRIRANNPAPLITLFKDANASTLFHETGHQWLEELARDAASPAAPERLRQDWKIALDWLGVKSYEEIKGRHHEKWARGFEQYLREGVAPSRELAGVFSKFKAWLTRIYETLKGLGAPINDDIRGVFDRMIALEPQRAVVAAERELQPQLHHIHENDADLFGPHEAEPAADRIIAEADMSVQDMPAEIAHEIQPRIQAAEQARAGAGTEPAGETGGGAEPSGNVEPTGARPGAVAESGGMGEGASQKPSGGATPVSESGGLFGKPRGPELPPLAARPVERLKSESPALDKAGNIRLDNFREAMQRAPDRMEAFKDILRQWAEANEDFIGRRRGKMTMDQMLDGARRILGEEPDRILQKRIGEAFSAEENFAIQQMAASAVADVHRTAELAKSGDPAAVMAHIEAKNTLNLVQGLYSQATAESGRALFAMRKISEFWATADAQSALRIAKEATGKTLFQNMEEAQMVLGLEGDPEKIAKFAADSRRKNFGRMLLEYWINCLISSVPSQATYTVAGSIMRLHADVIERGAAAAVGAVARRMGREGGVRAGEIGAAVRGMAEGVAPGLHAGGQAAKYGVSTPLPGEKPFLTPFETSTELAPRGTFNPDYQMSQVLPDLFGALRGARDSVLQAGAQLKAGGVANAPAIGWSYNLRGEIPNLAVKGVTVLPLGDVARASSRMNSFFDGILSGVGYSAEKNALAYRQAVDEGLSGAAFHQRVAELRQNPTPEMMEQASKGARDLSLLGKGGDLTQRLLHLTNYEVMGTPILKFVAPFVRVAGNTFEQSLVRRSPLGLFSQQIRDDLMGKHGAAAQDMAAGRIATGTILALTFGGLAAEGLLSSSGPTDPHEAAMWRLAGNQAHSVRIGDFWYDLRAMGPMAALANISADIYDVAHKAGSKELDEVARLTLHAFTQNIVDQSFMKGPADLIKAIEDSDRYGGAWVRQFLSSFVPFSTMSGQAARMSDPYIRQARTIADAMKAKIPGLSSELQYKRDIWGNPMPARQMVGGFLTFYAQKAAADPVNRALLEAGIFPAPVGRTIRNVELTDQQYDEYSAVSGSMAKMRLDQIVASPEFQSWPSHVKHDVMSEIVRQSRETARGVMMMKYPQIAVDSYNLLRQKRVQ